MRFNGLLKLVLGLLLVSSELAAHAQSGDFPYTDEEIAQFASRICKCFEEKGLLTANPTDEQRLMARESSVDCFTEVAADDINTFATYSQEIGERVGVKLIANCPNAIWIFKEMSGSNRRSRVADGPEFNADYSTLARLFVEEQWTEVNELATIIIENATVGNSIQIVNVLRFRGRARYFNDDYYGAISDCLRALELLQDNDSFAWIDLHNTIAFAKLAIGDLPAAEEDIEAVLQVDPNNADAQQARAEMHYRNEDYPRAATWYIKAIELGNRDSGIYRDLGYTYGEMEEWQKCIEALDSAILLGTDEADIYNYRGYAYYELKQYAKCIEDYNKVLALAPGNATARSNRGVAYYYSKKYKLAEADLTQVMAMETAWTYFLWRARIRLGLKNYEGALADIEKGLEINNDAYLYDELGRTYVGLKQYTEAVEAFSTSLEMYADDPDIHFERAMAYQKAGQNEAACKDFERAWELGKEEARKAISKYCK